MSRAHRCGREECAALLGWDVLRAVSRHSKLEGRFPGRECRFVAAGVGVGVGQWAGKGLRGLEAV